MNVIVFASRKGAPGKSTLAAHLAAHVHKTSKPCLLIDADPQDRCHSGKSCVALTNRRSELHHALSANLLLPPSATASNGSLSIRRPTCPPWSMMPSATRRWSSFRRVPACSMSMPCRRPFPCRSARKPYACDQRRARTSQRSGKPDRLTMAREALVEVPRTGVGRPSHQPGRFCCWLSLTAKALVNTMRMGVPRARSAGSGLRSNVR